MQPIPSQQPAGGFLPQGCARIALADPADDATGAQMTQAKSTMKAVLSFNSNKKASCWLAGFLAALGWFTPSTTTQRDARAPERTGLQQLQQWQPQHTSMPLTERRRNNIYQHNPAQLQPPHLLLLGRAAAPCCACARRVAAAEHLHLYASRLQNLTRGSMAGHSLWHPLEGTCLCQHTPPKLELRRAAGTCGGGGAVHPSLAAMAGEMSMNLYMWDPASCAASGPAPVPASLHMQALQTNHARVK